MQREKSIKDTIAKGKKVMELKRHLKSRQNELNAKRRKIEEWKEKKRKESELREATESKEPPTIKIVTISEGSPGLYSRSVATVPLVEEVYPPGK